eukprot:250148_1
MVALTSAAGVLALLDEPGSGEPTAKLKIHALHTLDGMVDQFWPEIANSIPAIETLYEDESFRERQLAASVASKVFYHLEQLDESVTFALGAGDLFDVSEKSEYVETLLAQCIDRYIGLQVQRHDGDDVQVDARLVDIVERMFTRCYADGKYEQALGVALESCRLDKVREAITTGPNVKEMAAYCFALCQSHVQHRGFRMMIVRELVDIYNNMDVPDYINICQCLLVLDDAEQVAKILESLITDGVETGVTAFQVAFDLCENQNQPFLLRIVKALTIPGEEPPKEEEESSEEKKESDESMDTSDGAKDTSAEDSKAVVPATSEPTVEDAVRHRATLLRSILSGERSIDLHLQFLYSHCRTDPHILAHIMEKLDRRNSVTHNATVVTHAILQCGTTQDAFLRKNLEWMSRANNWAKFTASASFGVVHKGHIRESEKLLGSYLPKQGQQGSPYQEGGALYAMGLIHACHGDDKIDYLVEALKTGASNEIVQHGACLGLGLTAMATGREDIYQLLKDTLYHDNAVAGEAAGMAMGLVQLGTGYPQGIEDMIGYAKETKHEKIVRGLAMGLALTVYGLEESADGLIEQLCSDKTPIMRYGGCFAVALAYVGTGHNASIKRLLHIGVSDVNNDVRRAAVMAIGFVLCNRPAQVPDTVKLLAESFNPYARYGAAFAIGVACVATGMPSAVEILEPMLKDRMDYVRQAAQMALAMVFIQHNKTQSPKVGDLLELLNKNIDNKHCDSMTKMGAIIASGLINAGGQNCTIALTSASKHKRMASIVGMAIFLQYWYWYPLVHFITLAITPTTVIGLNKDLRMPKYFRFRSKAAPGLYDYPEHVKAKASEKKKKASVAELSITAKAKARRSRKLREQSIVGIDDMEIDKEDGEKKESGEAEEDKEKSKEVDKDKSESAKDGDAMDTTADTEADKEAEDKSEEALWGRDLDATAAKSKAYTLLHNPCRVTPHQQNCVEHIAGQRYVAVKRKLTGIVMLRDTRPNQEQNLIDQKDIEGRDIDNEPSPPKPFEFTRD